MEFAAPDYSPYPLLPILGIILGIGLIVSLVVHLCTKDFSTSGFFAGVAIVTTMVGALFFAGINSTKNSYDNSEALSQANPKVVVVNSYKNGLPQIENHVIPIKLMVKGTTNILECQAVLVDKVYTVDCMKPNDDVETMVSVDEAIEALDKKTAA